MGKSFARLSVFSFIFITFCFDHAVAHGLKSNECPIIILSANEHTRIDESDSITPPSRNAQQSVICNMRMLKMPIFTGLREN
jgi:hypothetical protein